MGREQDLRPTPPYVHKLSPLSPAPAVLLGTLSKSVLQDTAFQLRRGSAWSLSCPTNTLHVFPSWLSPPQSTGGSSLWLL